MAILIRLRRSGLQGLADETVGAGFQVDLLQTARDKTLEVILEASSQMKPGITEAEAKGLITSIQESKGSLKVWHPPQIRFGSNTLLAFGERGMENPALQNDDIFFFDIGPIFDGHEGDVGRTFFVGNDSEMRRCSDDVKVIWQEVQRYWQEHQVTGPELYDFAKSCAARRDWILSLKKANGHRIADFPHAARARGSIEGFPGHPASHRWILEIQIRHPSRSFGAFYEDLLHN